MTLTLTGPFVEVRDVDASQDWMTVFEGLPEVFTDSNGVEHPLNIEDLRVEGEEIENYVLSIIHPAVDEYVLNYTLANRKLAVQVVWDDKNNAKKTRPAVVEADLYADGTLYIKGTRITEEDGWVYPYEELPAYAEDSDQS